jgi:hypothetical protein
MAPATTSHALLWGIGTVLEHAATVMLGFILMVIGLGMGVTMVMLPFGLVIGLLGVAVFVSGVFARLDEGVK